jgi:hypothetical protein
VIGDEAIEHSEIRVLPKDAVLDAIRTALGTLLARRAAGEPAHAMPFPTTALRTIPFHGLRNLYVAAARTYYRPRDVTA